MEMFEVYPKMDLTPVSGRGCYINNDNGDQYLDFYGGHAVISIGHHHPRFTDKLKEQLDQINFYSNAVRIPLQDVLAEKLGRISGYGDYNLFLCNSGAEANENALKLASFFNGRKKVVVTEKAFHGRTGGVVAFTNNPKIIAPFNETENVVIVPFNDTEALKEAIDDDTCAFLIEGIQGISGVQVPTESYLTTARELCQKYDAVLILDEIQSGYARSGRFFAHQYGNIQPDLITVAKGMGNGFPIGGVLIHPKFKGSPGLLGTTFGGSHLACAAGVAVLDVIEEEELVENAVNQGQKLMKEIKGIDKVKEARGHGLMIGIEFDFEAREVRSKLLAEKIITGSSADPHTMRLLPPLCINNKECDQFLDTFNLVMKSL